MKQIIVMQQACRVSYFITNKMRAQGPYLMTTEALNYVVL